MWRVPAQSAAELRGNHCQVQQDSLLDELRENISHRFGNHGLHLGQGHHLLTVDHREAVPRLGALGRLSTFRLPFARLRLFPAAIVGARRLLAAGRGGELTPPSPSHPYAPQASVGSPPSGVVAYFGFSRPVLRAVL